MFRMLASAIVAAIPAAAALAEEPLIHETFDDIGGWRIVTADGVRLDAARDPAGATGACLRLDYDFTRGSGFAIVRHEFAAPLVMPANHRFSFQLKGEGPRNTMEFKLVQRSRAGGGEATAENVWWINRPDFEFAGPWREVRLPKRKFSFAWGPEPAAAPRTIDAIEFVITSFNGGRGTVWLDDLKLLPLPEILPYTGTPRVEVTSRLHGDGALGIGTDGFLGWRSGPIAADATPAATADFGEPREFGGLALRWEPGAHAVDFDIAGSLDGATWFDLAEIRGGNGGLDDVVAPDTVARHVRIRCRRAASEDGVHLRSLRVLDPAYADDPNNRIRLFAAESPRGWWPRQFVDEASYWTVIGADGDDREALVSEDGAIELGKAGPSIEPFIVTGDKVLTWAESRTTQSLEDGYLPIPTVMREAALRSPAGVMLGMRLEVTSFVDGLPPLEPGKGVVLARYRVTNIGVARRAGTLYLAARPLQVNPPYQFLNTPGGAARVESAGVNLTRLSIGGSQVFSLTPPVGGAACAWEHGEIVEHIASARLPDRAAVDDADGLASAALAYPFSLDVGERMTVIIAAPLHGDVPEFIGEVAGGEQAIELFEQRKGQVAQRWRDRVDRVALSLPDDAQRLWDTVRSNLAYILINRDGPSIQPGSRSYERSWIRDGSLTSAAMLAFGLSAEAEQFVDWYAPNQYESGRIPCVVDRRGPDPVPEHDSDGEFIFAVMNVYRHTGDASFLRRHFERVVRAAGHIEMLRSQRTTDEFGSPDAPAEKRVLYGLVPESISHEGYSAKPMHSYWDDFWAIKGLSDAAEMAEILGEAGESRRLAALRDAMTRSVGDSIRLAMQMKSIEYIPGCAELGDFDATSTTIGVWPCDLRGTHALPEDALNATFARYWRYFEDRRAGTGAASEWINYTPYEWRTVGTLVRLGRRDRVREAIEFFMADSRPAGFNHWAEVVWRDPRRPGFIGDMPHTWCGSDFINSFRAMFAYDDDRAKRLVIGAGLPMEWVMTGEGVMVRGLGTHAGKLTFSARRDVDAGTSVWKVEGGLRDPAGGVWIAPPRADLIEWVEVDGARRAVEDGMVRLPRTPCVASVRYGD